jgi:adenine-specific DNA-methyltransferase
MTDDRLAELQAIVPEAFADGKINWEALKEALTANLEEQGSDAEHFGLFWPGKRQARRLAAMPSRGALHPVPGEGIDEETTRNVFVEGDNLEVLKLLLKSYSDQVKMIFIDPPYNTGNDFVYEDDFTDSLEVYLRKIGRVDDSGMPISTNRKADGRFHSNWLTMMYPRLLLARQLLREDGVIFVSIDDVEAANLRLLLNEIFGEENFVAQIIWQKSYGGGPKTKLVVGLHEYVLCYARNKEQLGTLTLPPDPDARKYYTGKDEKYPTRGPFRTQALATNSMDERANLRFAIPWKGEDIWPEKQWLWSPERVERALAQNELVFSNDRGKWTVNYKQYLYDEDGQERGAKPFSVLDGPYTQVGTAEIKELFGDGKAFSFPKPSSLVKHFLGYVSKDKQAIILDFFAGSATTAQAVLDLNREDGAARRFIMVQLPEKTGNSQFPRDGSKTQQ